MNGFEQHSIDHSSISNLNKWIGCPSAWVAHYLYGKKGSASPAMWRGIFTEQAVSDVLTGKLGFDAAIHKAIEDYDSKILFDDNGSAGKERGNIVPMTELAVAALEQYRKPDFPEDGSQHRVSLLAKGDDWEVEFMGYVDFKYPELGLVVDLKTTMRMPSTMAIGHQRQRAFYAKATNYDVKFLYVTPKKCEMKEDGDVGELMADIKAHLTRQEAFLRLGDKDLLKAIVPVDPDSFYWKGDEKVRKEMYGV